MTERHPAMRDVRTANSIHTVFALHERGPWFVHHHLLAGMFGETPLGAYEFAVTYRPTGVAVKRAMKWASAAALCDMLGERFADWQPSSAVAGAKLDSPEDMRLRDAVVEFLSAR